MPNYRINKQTGNPDTLIAGGTVFADTPIGTIISSGRAYDNPPDGYFFCDGRALSRTTYADLFAAIGTSFGSGDGSTTFNIPDGREATFKGAGLTSKSNNHYDADGVALGEFIDDRVQDHDHIYGVNNGSEYTGWTTSVLQTQGSYTGSTAGVKEGARSGATTEVKSFGVNYFIKATNVPVPADFMSAVDDAVEVATETINTLLTKMQTTYTITPQNTEAILAGGFGCQRVGNVVMIQVTPNIRVTNQQTLLATGFPKPSSEIRFQCTFQNAEGKHLFLYLDSNGELQTVGNFPSGTPFEDWLVGFVTYITTDPLPN